MRTITAVGLSMAFFTLSAWSQDERPACELLPVKRVSAIVGMAVHVDAGRSAEAELQPNICIYRGPGVAIRFSIRTSNSEIAARSDYAQQVAEVFSGMPHQLLRGVGAEARFGARDKPRSGVIVARYDTIVMVLSGSQDQATLVKLMRSAIAQLSSAPHEAHL